MLVDLATPSDPVEFAPLFASMRAAWNQRKSDQHVAAFVVRYLHAAGYHGLCRTDAEQDAAEQANHSAPLFARVNCRHQLLALGWVISHTRLFDRYIRMVSLDCSSAWFVPSFHRGAVVWPRTPPSESHQSDLAAAARRRESMSHYAQAQQPTLFTQPLLPPAWWDSAATHTENGWLDQDQEYRLLQQLINGEQEGSVGSTATRPTMCLPPTSDADDSDPYGATRARLVHRVHQCIATHGKIQFGLKEMADLTRQQAELVAKLHVTAHSNNGARWVDMDRQVGGI